MDIDHYRGDLGAAFARISLLENELALFRSDPAHERVEVAEENLKGATEVRLRLQRLLPKLLILSFVCLGAYALTDEAGGFVSGGAFVVTVLGAATGLVSLAGLLFLLAQGPRPASIRELERNVRLAKADVGARHRPRVRVEDRFEAEARAELEEEFPSAGEEQRLRSASLRQV